MNDKQKYFIYARKSTDVEDKQVLSIEAQLVELRAYARTENIEIIDEFIEKQSAKVPGRPIFGDMLKRLEAGEASGILSWHPDRLARNSVDGGQIVYLLDQMHLQSLKFPTFWFENTSQGKFMLSIAFGQSKYYVDNLSENTKRGLRQKVRRGEMPGRAPLGYINDVRNKTVIVDKRNAPLVHAAFELYAKGDQRLRDVADFLANKGVKTNGGLPLKKDQIAKMLTNPFYYGHFRYAGEIYEGKHTPIVSKKLFDEVQTVFDRRKHKRTTKTNTPKPLCGLLRCGSCGMMITADTIPKHQKNGVTRYYTYYHCTKKCKGVKCPEPHIRAELLDEQLSSLLNEYALPDTWHKALSTMLDTDGQNAERTSGVFIAQMQTKIANLQSKLQRLLDSYLDQDVEHETYLQKKAELMSEKKSLEEQSSKLTLATNAWLKPARQWLNQANSICKVAQGDDPFAKKELCQEIFGSNLILKSKKAQPTAAQTASPPKNIWVLLRKTKEKAAR
ncbi:MAG: recombinase family protein, partial [Candidatus Saccharimonas aalborgensis]